MMKNINLTKRRFWAKIYWLLEEQGGRKKLPSGTKYLPILILEGDVVPSEENWSAYVLNRKTLSRNETISEIEYFSEFAPDNLRENTKFQLYEGKKRVAKGIILEEKI